jgi:hypothetical protein
MFYWGILIGMIIGVNTGILFSAMLFVAKRKEVRFPSREVTSEDSLVHDEFLLDNAS